MQHISTFILEELNQLKDPWNMNLICNTYVHSYLLLQFEEQNDLKTLEDVFDVCNTCCCFHVVAQLRIYGSSTIFLHFWLNLFLRLYPKDRPKS